MSELSLARFRRCALCAVLYPGTPTYFHKNKAKPLGIGYQCRACKALYDRTRHLRQRAKHRAQVLAYYHDNREASLQRWREWHAAKRERDPEWWAKRIRTNNSRRRSLRENADGHHTQAEVLSMLKDQGGLCAYCGSLVGDSYEVDHMIPLSRGGRDDWTNLAVVCGPCNRRKGKRTAEEFMSATT